ncbi:hypothetical protein L6452_14448 [Arctium lappa]|uniref:Uncharacterized protein n=1 Tax=Arctium lappa TaxID=4217 RepID=A0ACB9CL54_ARCLA|nr:hypothetical protein L6452_14448 [Arctium lappa]
MNVFCDYDVGIKLLSTQQIIKQRFMNWFSANSSNFSDLQIPSIKNTASYIHNTQTNNHSDIVQSEI